MGLADQTAAPLVVPPSAGKFLFLDRDGVINRDRPRSVCSLADFEMLPGAGEAIAALNDAGYQIIVATNQACIGRGDLSQAGLAGIHGRLREELAAAGALIAGIYVCPHIEGDDCDCRKPKPGLLLQAAKEHGIDLPSTWFVGDARRDVEAAWAAGCRPAVVRTGKALDASLPAGVPVFDDLGAFAAALRKQEIPC